MQKHRDQLGRAGPSQIGNGDMPVGGAPAENGLLPEAALKPAAEAGQAGAPGNDEAMPDASLAAGGLPPQRVWESPRDLAHCSMFLASSVQY